MFKVGSQVQIREGYSLNYGGRVGTVACIKNIDRLPIGIRFNDSDTTYYFSMNELIYEEDQESEVIDY